ncbi:MAG: dienelactone hydrolase family protein, partial [Candidatus Scalindua sp.]|nr:dienelactone hydrolase family protein [Candidatus Scalindua sp.]MCR4343744.1 dienelactone hydrolase family protein [Candidatus Scalindua sp.]
MRININSFVIIAIFFVFPHISLADSINKKEGLRINEQAIKQLMQEYINTENSEKREEIKKGIIRIESNPDKLKELLINSARYHETQFAIHEKLVKISHKGGRYFLYIPKGYNPDTPYPLIVSLHGIGEGGVAFIGRWLRHSDHGQKYIFLCPHYDSGYWWEKDGEDLVLDSIKQVCAEQNIDTDRIYLTGFSSGAHGVWYISIRNPDIFAAIAPIAGECIISQQIENLLHVPVFIIHGDQDGDIPIAAARDARDKLQKLNYEFKYLEIPGQRHAYPIKKSNEILKWFESKKRNSRPHTIHYSGNLSEERYIYWIKCKEIIECFDLLNPTHQNRSQESLNNDIDRFHVTECHSIDIKVKENKIIVKSQNIKNMLLFLDDKLIDITKPVDV